MKKEKKKTQYIKVWINRNSKYRIFLHSLHVYCFGREKTTQINFPVKKSWVVYSSMRRKSQMMMQIHIILWER